MTIEVDSDEVNSEQADRADRPDQAGKVTKAGNADRAGVADGAVDDAADDATGVGEALAGDPSAPGGLPALLRRAAGHAAPLLSASVALVIWYFISYAVLEPDRQFLVPPPHDVLNVAILDWDHLQPMLQALALTARVALLGLLIAVGIGVTSAVLMSRARWLERSLYPYAVVLQTVPILAIVPLIGMWFGFGYTSRTVVCVIIALFPMIANTLFGLQSVDREHHDLFTLQRASRWARLIKLELPAALPAIFTGLRTSAGLSVIGAIVGDMFFKQGEPGIGTLLDVYRARLQSEDLYAAIILASLFGVAVFALFSLLNRLVVGSWHASGANR